MAEHGPRREQLIQGKRAVEDVAADEPELALEIERAERTSAEHARLEVRRDAIDRVDHEVGYFVSRVVPRSSRHDLRQIRMRVLAEEARDVHSRRCEAVVDDRGHQHFDDRSLRPAVRPFRSRR